MGLEELFLKHEASLEKELSACVDARSASVRVGRFFDELTLNYAQGEDDPTLRARINALCRAAKGAAALMDAVSEWDVSAREAMQGRAKAGIRTVIAYAPGALSAALAIWLYLSNNLNAAIVALAGAFLSVIVARERRSGLPELTYQVNLRANAREATRRIGFICREIDALAARPETSAHGERLGAPLIEAVQMLLEAKYTNDGEYALKSVPQLVDALSREGVSVKRAEDGKMEDYDLLPAQTGGRTIRPAVYMDGELIARGQVTVKK